MSENRENIAVDNEEDMKPLFDFCLGNPPYQGDNHQQLYPFFYLAGQKVSDCCEMIFPTGWQDPKNANNLGRLNKPEVKEDPQVVFIDNRHNAFPGVPGAENTNVVLWLRGHDNGLDGAQNVLTEGQNGEVKRLLINKEDIPKPAELIRLKEIVMSRDDFKPMSEITSVLKPYGLRTDFMDNPEKYGLPNTIYSTKQHEDDIKIYGLKEKKRVAMFIPLRYPLPKTPLMKKYKILLGKAWGGPDGMHCGGSYADILIAGPNEICTENYLLSGNFDEFHVAIRHAKYVMSRFCRALVFMNKNTHDNSKDKWIYVPQQDYSEFWWNESIAEIDEHLFEKYNVPEDIREFVKKNIQPRTVDNIINYDKECDE